VIDPGGVPVGAGMYVLGEGPDGVGPEGGVEGGVGGGGGGTFEMPAILGSLR